MTGLADEKEDKLSINYIQRKLMSDIIDDYVDEHGKETNTMEDLLKDLEEERLIKYMDKNYHKKLSAMEL